MNTNIPLIRTACVLALAFSAATPLAQAASYRTDLVRCSDTGFGSTLGICGGDDLASGGISLAGGGKIAVAVKGALASPFSLYEVYWLPIGAAVTSAVLVGNFATDCNGNAKAILKTINTPDQALSKTGTKINLFTAAGTIDAGNFIVYDRGPWGHDDLNADCEPDNYNTTMTPNDTDPTNPLANPTVVLGVDGVQFLSGYHK